MMNDELQIDDFIYEIENNLNLLIRTQATIFALLLRKIKEINADLILLKNKKEKQS